MICWRAKSEYIDFEIYISFTAWNNRVIKKASGYKNGKILYTFEIRNAAVYNSINHGPEVFEDSEFIVTSGDYNQLLHKVNEDLRNSLNFTANNEETNMIEDYIKSFKTGDVNAHKNGSRLVINCQYLFSYI